MRETVITIPGFGTDLSPDDKPAVGVYGVEGTGKTRFAATMEDPIGLIALDKKSRRTFGAVTEELGKVVVANTSPIISDKDAIRLAMMADDNPLEIAEIEQKSKEFYRAAVNKVFDLAGALASNEQIKSVVLDTSSQMWSFILYKHFGRLSKIPPISRANANQDMIDLINMLRTKNLCLIHRSKEIWKDSGRRDKEGNKIQEPSGVFEPEGFKGIGGFLTLTAEMTNNKSSSKSLEKKFRMTVRTCQTKPQLEGTDLHEMGVSGEEITWENVMMMIGIGA